MQLTNPSKSFQPMAIAVTLSPDGGTVYVSGRGAWAFVRATGRQLASNDDTQIGGVFASSDGAVIATLFDGTIERLDPNLRVVASVPGARGWVSDVRFSDDGALMAARGNDDTVTLYDVDSQQRIGDPITISQDATIDINAAGTELSIAGPDGVVIWSLDRGVWIDAACRIADRQLTSAERETYLAGLDQDTNTCQSVV
jgi:WD40 repeat protein